MGPTEIYQIHFIYKDNSYLITLDAIKIHTKNRSCRLKRWPSGDLPNKGPVQRASGDIAHRRHD